MTVLTLDGCWIAVFYLKTRGLRRKSFHHWIFGSSVGIPPLIGPPSRMSQLWTYRRPVSAFAGWRTSEFLDVGPTSLTPTKVSQNWVTSTCLSRKKKIADSLFFFCTAKGQTKRCKKKPKKNKDMRRRRYNAVRYDTMRYTTVWCGITQVEAEK